MLRKGVDIPFVVRPTRSVRAHELDHPGFLVTKAGEKYPSLELDSARQVEDAVEGFGAVWIDEPMLFDHEADLFGAVVDIRTRMPVLISGCSATSELEPFLTSFPKLISIADDVVWRKSDCDECGRMNHASRAFYLLGQKSEKIVVGGEESYEPLCPSCWNKRTEARCG